MYSPKIDETLIPYLYRVAKKKGVSQTKLVNEILKIQVNVLHDLLIGKDYEPHKSELPKLGKPEKLTAAQLRAREVALLAEGKVVYELKTQPKPEISKETRRRHVPHPSLTKEGVQ